MTSILSLKTRGSRSVALAVALLALMGCGRTEPRGGPPVDLAKSTVTVDRADGVRADGQDLVHILVTLKDAADRGLDNRPVRVTASGDENTIEQEAELSDVDGQLRATLTSIRAELKTITAVVDPDGDPQTLEQQPTVGFVGAVVDPARSTVVANPTSLTADGIATTTITVTLEDPRGFPVPGKTVQLSATGEGNRIGQPVRTDRNGVATGTLSSVVAEAKVITATVDPGPSGLALAQTPTVTFMPGPPSSTKSLVSAAPTTVPADGVSVTTVTVTVKDAQGNPVPGQTVRLSASGTANLFVQPSTPTDAQGIATGTLASTKAEVKTITALVNNGVIPGGGQIVVAQTARVTFVAGAVSARTSTITVSPPSVVANGVAVATVTVTARDTFGNPVPGQTVSLAVTGTRNTVVQPGLTNAAGVATGTLASTKAELKSVTATLNPGLGAVVLPPATARFVAGPADPVKSTLAVSPPMLVADGRATATITVTLLDAFGNPVSGTTVAVGASGTGNLLTQPAGPTDLAGVTTATLAATRAELKQVGAVANPGPSGVLLSQFATVTFVPGLPSATTSTVTANPARVVADGAATSTITVTVRDAFGNPIPGQTVQLATTGSANVLVQPSGPTNAAGVATGTLASTRAEAKTITATVNPGPSQVVLAQQPTVTFVAGAPSPTTSTVTASPSIVSADGVATTTVTVTLRDANGNLVSGAAVQLTATGSQNLFTQPTVTGPTGVTTGTLASTRAEVKTITAIANPGPGQIALTQQPTVTFVPGAPSAANSTISASPLSLVADGVAVSTITVTVRDAGGNPVPGQTVQLAATGSGNALAQPAAVTDASGVAVGKITSTRAEVKTVSAIVNPGPSQVAISQTVNITFTAGPPSALTSTLVANPTSVPADGVATSTLTVTVRDANGNPIPGQTVRLAATGTNNTLVQPVAVTDAAGVATGTLASTRVEVKTVSATVNPGAGQVVLSQQATVTFTVGAPSPTTSTVTVNPATVLADGVAFTTITVTVRDAGGNPVPGQTVMLAATGTFNGIMQPVGPTDAAGVATGTLASTKAETKTLTATVNPGAGQIVIAQQPTVTFVAGRPSATLSTLTALPSTVVADGTSVSTLTVTVKDAFNNPVPGQTVQLAATGSNNILTQPAAVTDANGVATGTLASTTVQVDTVTATVNPGPSQVVVTQQAMVTFISGAPSAIRSTVTVNPSTVVADGVAFTTVTVTVLDAGGNPIPGMVVQLAATGSGNAITQPAGTTNASGVATGRIASTKAEVKTVSATVNPGPGQVVIAQQPTVTFIAGPPDANMSTVTANPISVVADGVAFSTITVTVRDAQGNPVQGQTVQLAATGTGNLVTQPAGVTDAAGVITGRIASTQAEAKTVTATVNPGPGQVVIAQQPVVTFTAGPPSATTSTVVANPTIVVADGVATTVITVMVRDAQGNPVSGATVSLAATGTANTFLQPAATNASGVTTGLLKSTKAEAKTITATVNPGPSQVVLSQQPVVTFVPGPPSATVSTVIARPTSVPADAVSTSTITVTVNDAQGNPIPNAAVTLAATGRANTLVQPGPTSATGVTTGTLASGQAEAKTVTATVSGVTLAQQPTVTFISGPPGAVPGNNTCAQASSLALDPANGRVALAFYQGNNLYFTQCTANCVTTPVWSTPQTVDTNVATCARPDAQVSMLFLGPGQPVMAYADVRNGNAKYAVLSGNTWRTSIIGSTGGTNVSGTTALALVGTGNVPAVAYHTAVSTTQGTVQYATCLSGCATGTGVSWRNQVVDNQGNSGQSISLAVDPVSKLPRLAYSANLTIFGVPVSLLNYATCVSASTTNTCDTARGTWSLGPADGIAGGGQTGRWTSLGIGATGATKVSYQNASTGRLMMATCQTNCGNAGSTAWAISTVDAGTNTGWYTALKLDSSDQAHIAYVAASTNTLRYAVQVGNTTTFTIVDADAPVSPGIPALLLSPPGTNFSYANANGMKFYPSGLF